MMYIPSHFNDDNKETAYEIMDRYGFGLLVSPHESGESDTPYLTHLPLLREGNMLLGHVARSNKHWKRFEGEDAHTAVFQGAHGYISPTWYESKEQVPTWAYAVVHVTGKIELVVDEEEINAFMHKLSSQYEGPEGWTPAEVDPKKYTALKRGIVCFKMEIETLQCKLKLNQNKPMVDQRSVFSALPEKEKELKAELGKVIDPA